MNRTYLITGLLTVLVISLLAVVIGPERIKTAVVGGGDSGVKPFCADKDDIKKSGVTMYNCENEKVLKYCKLTGEVMKGFNGVDVKVGHCAECLEHKNCSETKPFCKKSTYRQSERDRWGDKCYECNDKAGFSCKDPKEPACNLSNECVRCTADKHCTDKKNPNYDPGKLACGQGGASSRSTEGFQECVECARDRHCADKPGGVTTCCNEWGNCGDLFNSCVKSCTKDSDCKVSEECVKRVGSIHHCAPKKSTTISESEPKDSFVELARVYTNTLVNH